MRAPYAVAARELLRDSLLDATRDLLRDRSWADVTMADVAAAAGVSRQTLYNEFGSRQEFAQAYVLREGDRFVAAVEDALRAKIADPADALAAAFEVFLTAAAYDPFVRMVVAGDASRELLSLVTTEGEPLLARTVERLAEIIVSLWPQAPGAEAQLLSEAVVRLAISYAALPGGPASMTADSVARILGPYIERTLDADPPDSAR